MHKKDLINKSNHIVYPAFSILVKGMESVLEKKNSIGIHYLTETKPLVDHKNRNHHHLFCYNFFF